MELKKHEKNEFQFPQIELISTLYTPEQLKDIAFEDKEKAVQVAFAGRSNVGKSSLLNALAKRKNLAKVSSTPGKTRSVNFFYVKKMDLFLVDLPGYGYAKRSKSERDIWAGLISDYLENTLELKLLLVLIDARIPPQELDKEMLAFGVSLGLQVQPVLTKCDKVKQKELGQCMSFWQKLSHRKPIAVSAHNGYGLVNLWKALEEVTRKEDFLELNLEENREEEC